MFQRRPRTTASHPLCPALCLLAASAALANPILLDIDPAQSSIDVELCITLGSMVCGSDQSPVGGTVSAALDCLTEPTTIALHDFNLALLETIDLNLNFGAFIGQLNATGTGITVSYATPGVPREPVAIVAGVFTDVGVPVVAEGVVAYTTSGPLICILMAAAGLPCSGSIDLSTIAPDPIDLAGTVGVVDRTVTIAMDLDVTAPLDPANPDQGTFSMVGTVLAQGDAPLPDLATFIAVLTGENDDPDAICDSDINQDGAADGLDIAAYIELLL